MECGDNNNHSDNDNDNDDGCDDGNDITTARQRLKTGPAAGAGKAIWLYGPPTSGIRFDCRQQFRNFSLVNPPFREPLAGTLSLALSRGEFTRELLTRQVGARVSLSVMSGFSYFMCNFNTYYKLTALINVSVCV